MSAMLTAPAQKKLTAAEFAARYETDRVELVDGVVVELPMPFAPHGKICMMMSFAFMEWAMKNDLGHFVSHDSWIQTQTDPDRVRGPDFCFAAYDRWPRGPLPQKVMDVAPNLVVEVRSPSDRWNAMMAKTLEYLTAGVTVVVVVDPQNESVDMYRNAQNPQSLTVADTLTIPDVLPGFAFPVARLFS